MATFYIEAIEETNIAFAKVGNPTVGAAKYGINDTSVPTDYNYGDEITLSAGQKCYFFIGSSYVNFTPTNYVKFTSTGRIKIGGALSDLIGGLNYIPREHCFHALFGSCNKLVDASDLIMITNFNSKRYCYSLMFSQCTSLVKAPNLPATNLYYDCYSAMFSGCTSLVKAPNLPATTLKSYCYSQMFLNCSSLKSLPKISATELSSFCCQRMFDGCTQIKLSETETETYNTPFRIPASGTIEDVPTGALTSMFDNTGGTFTGTPEVNTTYYMAGLPPLPQITLDPKQIILFPPTETAFNNNGMGHLSDAISCLVTEERNGAFELEMQYPISGNHYADIAQRSVIMAKSKPNDDGQYFRVYRITKPINGIVSVYAAHISYDLAGAIVEPFTAGSAAAAMAYLENASVGDNGFTFSTDKSTVATMAVKVPSSVRSLLGGSENSVLDIYGGEWEFDRFNCYLHNNRGQDRGFTIRYGKNLTDLTQEENCASVYTAVYPYWSSSEGDTVITLPEKKIDVADVISGAHYDYSRVLVVDFSGDYQEQPTVTELRSHTQAYIRNNNIGIPSVSLSVSFVQLEQTAEYQDMAIAQQIDLCDTVSVEFEKLGVSAKAKVIKTVYNALLDRYEKIEIGDAKMSIADTIANQQEEIKKLDPANIMSDVEAAAIRASQLITGNRGGYVVLHSSTGASTPDEILIMDTPDIQTAQKVWRWNNSGLGYSSTGYNGTYTTAWTIDGAFNADFITAGFLSANRIKAGVITSEESDISIFNSASNTITINEEVYKSQTTANNNVFKYLSGGWKIRRVSGETVTWEAVVLSDYGITVNGTIAENDFFVVVVWDSKIIDTFFDLNSGELIFNQGYGTYKGVPNQEVKMKMSENGLKFIVGNEVLGSIESFAFTDRGTVNPTVILKVDEGTFKTGIETPYAAVSRMNIIDNLEDGNVFGTIQNGVNGAAVNLRNANQQVVAAFGANSNNCGTMILRDQNGDVRCQANQDGFLIDAGGYLFVRNASKNNVVFLNSNGITVTPNHYIALNNTAITNWGALNSILSFSNFHGTLVYGRPTLNGNYSSCVVPSSAYGDTKKWQLADERNWISFTVDDDGVASYFTQGGPNPSDYISGYVIF